MIYHYKTYPGLSAFLQGGPKSAEKSAYTLFGCCNGSADENGVPTFTADCFGCLFCLFGEPARRSEPARRQRWECCRAAENAFCGQVIEPPPAPNGQTLAAFMAAQSDKLPAWAAGLLHHTCSGENHITMGLPVQQYCKAAGVLAVALAAPENFLMLDTKATVAALLADPDYKRHHAACLTVLTQAARPWLYLVLLGGPEPTPAEWEQLSAVADGKLRFLTVNALWCLSCGFLLRGEMAGWDKVLPAMFAEEACRGLTTAGRVMRVNGRYLLAPAPGSTAALQPGK